MLNSVILNHKNKIAIVVVGYNRLKSIKRLLSSLLNAHYPSDNVPLIISIDASGCTELYDYVNSFNWPFGDKYVNIQQERLGLKKHIYQCGDLSSNFKAVVILEDDLYVSPYFYDYVLWSVENYGHERRIAQISLYKNERNGYVGLPFHQQETGDDVFLMQDVSTWGECFTEDMWNEFKIWRDSHTDDDLSDIDMPQTIKEWNKAWSKYYNAYVVDTSKYVLYPSCPVTTNFSDAGVHGSDNNSLVQVNMLYGYKNYNYVSFDKLVKYDIYFNNENLYSWLEINAEDICLDIYGYAKDKRNNKRYLLSPRILPYKVMKSFALSLRPLEMNVALEIQGDSLFLYDTLTSVKDKNYARYSDKFLTYFFQGIWPHYMLIESFRHYKTRFLYRK